MRASNATDCNLKFFRAGQIKRKVGTEHAINAAQLEERLWQRKKTAFIRQPKGLAQAEVDGVPQMKFVPQTVARIVALAIRCIQHL